jgi:tetratricopeptide (TPR) repeat protein
LLVLSSRVAVAQGGDAAQQYAAAQAALAAGRYPEAEAAFVDLSKLEPNVAEVHANLGAIYFQEGKFDQAVLALRKALNLKPGLARASTLLALSLSELGQYKEALPGLEKAFQQENDPAIRRISGLQLERAYTGLGRDREAVEVALKMDELYPNDPEVLYHAGKVFGNFAYLTMHRLDDIAPQSVWRHLAAAEANESQGATELAMTEYRAVLALSPDYPGVHYRMGKTLLADSHQTGKPAEIAEARREFELELQSDPSNGNAAYELGEIYRRKGEFEEAGKYFEMALVHYPDFGEAHEGLAAVFLAQQKPALALPELQRAIALDPSSEVSWWLLSKVERSLGNSVEQNKALGEFLRLRQAQANQTATHRMAPQTEVTQQTIDTNDAPEN